MSGPSQLSNTTFQSPSKADPFDGGVALSSPGHHSFNYETFDAFGAFGAPDPSFDEDKRTEFIESFLDNDIVLREFIKSTREEDDDKLSNIHDALVPASNTLSPNPFAPFAPPPHLTTPVEDSYWSQLRSLSPSPAVSVYSLDFGSDCPDAQDLVDRPFPEDQPGLTLADIQVERYSSGPFFGTTDDSESSDGGEVAPDDYLSIVPAASSSSGSSSTASPLLPITPLDRHRALGEVRAGDVVQVVEAPNSPEEPAKGHDEDKSNPPSPSEMRSPESHEEQGNTVSPARRVEEDEDAVEPGMENREGPDDSKPSPVLAPAHTPAPTSAPPSENEVDQQVDNTPDIPVAGPSRKRKKVAKSRPTCELRELSRVPPQSKRFNIRGCFGRLSRAGTRKVLYSDVEAVSCCHLAGADGHCQFREAGGERCMVELPKNGTYARAHLNMHIDNLRWFERARRDPNWRPVCPWCGEARTKLEQLLRHILDSHLLVNVEWCPCGGTNSRANQKNNKGRHEDSERHQAYLREQAEKEAGRAAKEVESEDLYYEDEGVDESREGMVLISAKDEDEDDVQPEFVEGSSRGAKRRRLG